MGEIVSPAIARLREPGEHPTQARLREPGEHPAQARLREPGEHPAQAGLTEPSSQIFRGSLRDVTALVPEFQRKPVDGALWHSGSRHPHLDALVRRAGPGVGLIDLPVTVVNRRHQLVPHARVIEAVERSISALRRNPAEAHCELQLSAFGARMALSVDLPEVHEFGSGAGERLGLRLLCLNALAGGGPRLLLCWKGHLSFSPVPVGTTRLESAVARQLSLRIADVAPAVRQALEHAHAERSALARWRETLVTRDRLVVWVDGAARRIWGPRAAARLFHIAMSGWDAQPAYGFERVAPSRRTMRAMRPVPAAPAFAESAYDALFAAAWVANDRDDDERFDRVAEIPLLMRALLRPERAR
jgi:hypothetical protein